MAPRRRRLHMGALDPRHRQGPFRIDESMGIGTPTLALPLKRYFNLDGRSGSWTLAPQWLYRSPTQTATLAPSDSSSLRVTRPRRTRPLGRIIGIVPWPDCMPCCTWARDQPTQRIFLGSPQIKGRARLRSDGGYSARIGRPSTGGLNTWHAQIVYKHTLLSEGYTPLLIKTGIAVVF